MKKANQTTSTPRADIGTGVTRMLTFLCDNERRELSQELERHRERYEHYKRRASDMFRDAYSRKQLADEARTALAALPDRTAEFEETAKRLSRFPYLERIEADHDGLTFYTRLLFVPIRKDREHPEETRTCIGSFRIRYEPGRSRLGIHNEVFKAGYQHWSVNDDGSPCMGDWSNDFTRAHERGDVHGLATLLYSYLTSTDDGSAFISSHNWRDGRPNLLRRRNFRVGSHVMVCSSFTTNYDPDDHAEWWRVAEGTKGTVLESPRGSSNVRIRFDVAVSFANGVEGDGEDGRIWRAPRSRLISLKAKEYKDPNITTPESMVTGKLEALDALPDGSTYDDARKVLSLTKRKV